MPKAIRFHLDEHIDPDIAVVLGRFGIDAVTTVQQKILGSGDYVHWLLAHAQGRVIVTDDTDFLVAASRSSDHAGIVFCRRRKNEMGAIIRFLILIHSVYSPNEMRGRVEFVF